MQPDTDSNRVLIVMGVSGSGKTTIGEQLARSLRRTFLDADDFHSAEAKAKMRQSVPLTPEDRKPWIDAIVARLNAERDPHLVLACSALTRDIRARFEQEVKPDVVFVYLKVPEAELHKRLTERRGHYAKAGLLESQLATLEEPDAASAVIVEARSTADDTLRDVLAALAARYPKA